MSKFKIISVLAALLLIATSCADEDLSPIVTFDSAGKGAYPRLLDETFRLVNLFDINGSSYSYTVEFVDEQLGANVAEYILEMTYKGAAGDVGPIEYLRMSAGEFSTNGNGYAQAPTITIPANDALSKAGITADQLEVNDQFQFAGKVVLNDGSTFAQSNSSNTVYGAAFRGHFNFNLTAGCPSDIGGTYTTTTTGTSTDGCCPDETTVTGSVTLTDNGGGAYTISDFTAGLYLEWYDVYGITATTNMTAKLNDICNEVVGDFEEPFGSKVKVTGTRDADTGVITYEWINGFDDKATVVMTPQ